MKSEHIGRLLRPEPLLAAREKFARGQLDAAELRAAEDEAITSALRAPLQDHAAGPLRSA